MLMSFFALGLGLFQANQAMAAGGGEVTITSNPIITGGMVKAPYRIGGKVRNLYEISYRLHLVDTDYNREARKKVVKIDSYASQFLRQYGSTRRTSQLPLDPAVIKAGILKAAQRVMGKDDDGNQIVQNVYLKKVSFYKNRRGTIRYRNVR